MRMVFVPWRVSLCLPVASAVMAQGWTAYSPGGGCYRVDLPGTPTVNTSLMPVGGGQTVSMTEAVVQVGPLLESDPRHALQRTTYSAGHRPPVMSPIGGC